MSERTKAAIDRLVNTHDELGAEDFAAYSFLAFGILACHAPEVIEFILDRTDEQLEES